MAAWIGLGAAVVFLALWAAQTRRTLAALDANVASAMDQIGVQLSSRIDALTTLTRQLEPYDGETARRMLAMLCQCRGAVTGVSGPGEVQRQEDVIQTVIEQVRTVAGQHPEVWADALMAAAAGTRCDNREKFVQAGFDIRQEAKKMEAFFLEK